MQHGGPILRHRAHLSGVPDQAGGMWPIDEVEHRQLRVQRCRRDQALVGAGADWGGVDEQICRGGDFGETLDGAIGATQDGDPTDVELAQRLLHRAARATSAQDEGMFDAVGSQAAEGIDGGRHVRVVADEPAVAVNDGVDGVGLPGRGRDLVEQGYHLALVRHRHVGAARVIGPQARDDTGHVDGGHVCQHVAVRQPERLERGAHHGRRGRVGDALPDQPERERVAHQPSAPFTTVASSAALLGERLERASDAACGRVVPRTVAGDGGRLP